MLYRIVIVSEIVGQTGETALSVAPLLGEAERNNRRDEITGAMLFHDGQAALVVEGARADLDRLMARLGRDARHQGMTVVSDRPIVQRRCHQPMRLSRPAPARLQQLTEGRPLSTLGATEIETLLADGGGAAHCSAA